MGWGEFPTGGEAVELAAGSAIFGAVVLVCIKGVPVDFIERFYAATCILALLALCFAAGSALLPDGGKLVLGLLAALAAAGLLSALMKRPKGWRRAPAVPLLVALAASCLILIPELGDQRERVLGEPSHDEIVPRRLVLITVDTLRADALSPYNGGAGRPTPAFQRLAAESLLHRRAYSSSGWTIPGMASLMTGLSPRIHQANRETMRLAKRKAFSGATTSAFIDPKTTTMRSSTSPPIPAKSTRSTIRYCSISAANCSPSKPNEANRPYGTTVSTQQRGSRPIQAGRTASAAWDTSSSSALSRTIRSR